MAEVKATRFGYSDALLELGEKDDRIVVLDADLAKSTTSIRFKERFPERFFEMGIAEQNMLNVAAGLAIAGKIPFASSYGVFVTGRAWEQIRTMIAYSNLNVNFAGHAGISVGPDGATHQALEDIAIISVIPNTSVVVPCDHIETKKATLAAAYNGGPTFIRFGRAAVPTITTGDTPFEFGKANVLREGNDVTIIACGIMVNEALIAAEKLKLEGVSAEVINLHTVKPMDEKTILESAKRTNRVITAEEHQLMGGVGSMVASLLSRNHPVPVEMVGVGNRFGESGTPEELLQAFGCTALDIISAVKRVMKR
ncbi:MAG TPA: transketolase C-terminal domain-containing protein [Caldisericia bacterium]|nr:transketolase C-terminal domain-containing protein [Caldisericia bacterium]HPF49117.1 transketolase C-terminal domain-containing protein [Caldisericia bacterium]HPI83019.1 transketolase C-terminal domain-containing protein [Caldisericia bacterium]HPQ92246.1 transketolase C-terminal domain-containing protein [Caldisericia bacterium]HRV74656.1 transketolase C-terminal domain-containing protein [Caldisericia bacterium]